ncbi:hypothetical protein CY35_01G036900 [Sphagnum magellanicum]|nr:hypothetical protein CY35_01G036900 [Sphagnum magellanicum]
MAASSGEHHQPVKEQEEGGVQEHEDEAGWVEAHTDCAHLNKVTSGLENLARFDAPCSKCEDPKENWLCLTCHEVDCGRFVNGHMLAHSAEADHPLAIGFRDLSVWCFACEHYLDAQVIPQLRPVFDALHLMKFGVPAPPRAEPKSGERRVIVVQTPA